MHLVFVIYSRTAINRTSDIVLVAGVNAIIYVGIIYLIETIDLFCKQNALWLFVVKHVLNSYVH